MIARFMGALFAPKSPKFYTGRHRAPARFRISPVRAHSGRTSEFTYTEVTGVA